MDKHGLIKQERIWKVDNLSKALESINEALKVDPKIPQAWFNKGIIISKEKKYNEALAFFIRGEYLSNLYHESGFYRTLPSIIAHAEYLDAPYFYKRLISQYHIDSYLSFQKFVNNINNQCKLFDDYILYLNNRKEQYDNPERYYLLLGLITYYMGDAYLAYKIFDEKVDEINPKSLIGQYYLIISAISFHEEYSSIINYALKEAEFILQSSDINNISLYYAGQIFLCNGSYNKALNCFFKSNDFLPSQYMQIVCLNKFGEINKTNNLIENLIERESTFQQTGKGYLQGINKQNISLDNFENSFFKYIHYIEINEAISLVYNYLEELENDGIIKPSWDFIDTYSSIQSPYEIWNLLEETELEIKAIKNQVEQNALNLMSDYIKLKFNEIYTLEGNNDRNWLINKISEIVLTKNYNKVDLHKIICYYYLLNKLDIRDKILLDFFTEIIYLQSIKSTSFIKEVLKLGISYAFSITAFKFIQSDDPYFIKNLYEEINLIGQLVGTGFSYLIINYLEDNKDEIISFEEFKANFISYVLELRDKIGNSFDLKYSLVEFENWI